jgi:hypothetical protein
MRAAFAFLQMRHPAAKIEERHFRSFPLGLLRTGRRRRAGLQNTANSSSAFSLRKTIAADGNPALKLRTGFVMPLTILVRLSAHETPWAGQ